jgi:hypothetical protein
MVNDEEILKEIIESLKKIREKEKKISFLKKKIEEVQSKEVKEKILELIQFLQSSNKRQMENELGGVLSIEEESSEIEEIVRAEEKIIPRTEEEKRKEVTIEEYISKERMKPIDYFGRLEEPKEEVGGYLRIEEERGGEEERYGSETTPTLKIDLDSLWPRAGLKSEIEEMQNKIKGELIRKYKPKLRIEGD